MSRRRTTIIRWTVALLFFGALILDSQYFFSTSVTQQFHVDDLPAAAANLSVHCNGSGITDAGDVRINIPAGLNCIWNPSANPSIASVSTPGIIANPFPPGCYEDAGKTLVINTQKGAAWSPGVDTFDIGNLQFSNFTAPSAPSTLLMGLGGAVTPGYFTPDRNVLVDPALPFSRTIRIADWPNQISSGDQTIFPGTTVTLSPITIQESNTVGNGGIWAGGGTAATDFGIRIQIPSGLGVTWNTGSVVTSVGTTKVAASVSENYEAGNFTVVIPVSGDFSAGESVTISGLQMVVSSSAADTSFQLRIRNSRFTNTTISRVQLMDTGIKTIVGLPTISSAANQFFTGGDPSTTASNITIRNSPGTTKITTTNDIRIKIPSTFAMTWDPGVAAVTILPPASGPSAVGKLSAVVQAYEDSNQTVVLTVTSNWSASGGVGEGLIVQGLKFLNFTGTELADNLELETTGDTTSEATDDKTMVIGTPTILSNSNQVFQTSPPGAANVAMAPIVLRDDVSVPRIGVTANRISTIRIAIPATFNMTFQNIATATVNNAKLNTAVTYSGGNKIATFTANADFAANEAVQISGLGFTVGAAASTPANLELYMSATGTVTDLDNRIIAVGGVATIASAANQEFTTNDPVTTAQNIVITDANGVASITANVASGDLRITIPAGFNMLWNTGVTVVTISAPPSGPSAAAKVSGTLLAYEDGGRTAVLDVTSNFAINEGFTVSGLQFTSFSNASPSNHLEVRVTPGGPAANSDTSSIAIGRPTISTPANQVFGVGDVNSTLTPTTCGTITITDDASTPRITTANLIRIRIPAGLNMTWDTAVTTPTITWLTAGPSKVAGTLLPYEDLNKTAVVSVTTNFVGGDSFTIAGLRFANIAAQGGGLPLGLEVNNLSLATNADDGSTILLSNRPTIVSTTTLDTNGNGSIDRLVVTFSEAIDQTTTTALNGLGMSLAGYAMASGAPGVPNVNSVTYLLAETGLPDTGALPILSYDPVVGTMKDLQGLKSISTTSVSQIDGAAPVIVGFQAIDSDGNGRLNTLVVTFSETLATGQEDIGDWVLVDANGTTNLLAGLTTGSLAITNASGVGTVTFTLTNTDGTAGVPRFQYSSNGLFGRIQDTVGNFVPFQTNNTAPVANAGPDIVLAPTKVTLNGTGSTDADGQPVNYLWTQIGGPVGVTLSSVSAARPSFLATTAGMYQFQLEVTDNLATAFDTVNVQILNVAPITRIVFNQVRTVAQGGVILFGDISTDINGDSLTFLWNQLSGPVPPVTPDNFVDKQYTPSVAGVYVHQLTGTDTAANSSTDRVQVRVHSPGNFVPTAEAGPDLTVPVNSLVTLNGGLSCSPSGNAVTYAWTMISPVLPLTNATTATPSFSPSLPGSYVLQLVVTDGAISSAPDTVTVNAFPANRPPVAVATKLSPVLHPIVGQLVTLDSAGSVDPEGKSLSYAWLQTEGPTVLLSSLSAPRPTFTAVAPGSYTFQLLATDGSNWSLPASVRFPIKPDAAYDPPAVTVASSTPAQPNGHYPAGSAITLDATVSGSNSHIWWEQIAGPATPFNAPSPFPFQVQTVNFTPPVAGLYTFRATVFDYITSNILTHGLIDIVVDSGSNAAPTAAAGANQTGNAGGTITLNGGGSSDPEAATLTGFWTQLSGPPVTLTNPNSLQPTFVPPVPGTYVFELKVSDGSASSAPSLVQITVGPGATLPTGGGGGGGCGLGAESLLFVALLLAARRTLRR